MDAQERLLELLERLATATETIAVLLETAPQAQPGQPGRAAQAPGQPTFCGFVASWVVDGNGYPSYVVDDEGLIYDRHERQGDFWWSHKSGEDSFERILTIRSGETLPEAARWKAPAQAQTAQTQPQEQESGQAARDRKRTAAEQRKPQAPRYEAPQTQASAPQEKAQATAAQPKAEPPDPDNPFTTVSAELLQRLHAFGRQIFGEQWQETGPQLVSKHSDGRTNRSTELSHAEAVRLMNDLTEINRSRKTTG